MKKHENAGGFHRTYLPSPVDRAVTVG